MVLGTLGIFLPTQKRIRQNMFLFQIAYCLCTIILLKFEL